MENYNRDWKRRNKDKVRQYYLKDRESVQFRFRSYKHSASIRNLKFNLSLPEFTQFWQKPCYYCKAQIANIGLDRVDSTQGYSVENVVPCCKICNWMKSRHSQEDFIVQCNKIAQNFK